MLLTFVLLMVLHPTIYQRAQNEIDGLIGGKRLPSLADRHELPYVNCVIKEVHR